MNYSSGLDGKDESRLNASQRQGKGRSDLDGGAHMGISIWQLLIVLVIILLLFGTKKLRNVGADLGSAIKHFRSAVKEPDENQDTSDPRKLEDRPAGTVIEGEVAKESAHTARKEEKV